MIVPSMSSVLRQAACSQSFRVSVRHFSQTAARDASWGFIGLGAMGYPMAKNLRAKIPEGDMLTIFDLNKASLEQFTQEATPSRVVVAKSPREVAEKSDHIISALPEPRHVKGVFEEILASPLPKPPSESSRLFIDCSTIDPTTSREVAKLVKEKAGAGFVDAPMSGGVVGARAGTLTFMVGGEKEDMPKIQEILLLMGKKVWHMGPQGTGLSGKLANNYALAINNIACAEAMNLGMRWGIEGKALADLLNSATGKSWPSEINNPVPGVLESSPATRGYEGGFGVSLMNKDLRLAMTAAQEAGAKLVLAEKAKEVYDSTEKEHKGKDFSVVYRWLGGKV
ncbi:3-hydroxyisobutyrate dehydrogenase [Cladophialophora carrionii CBS 160.54]|uniref:3-hydroxyisobutyrate dehydrogenase n=1 Tax=Cladophialophora carrionii CBS 160.54 TaxID=1279043 RepID=V9D529_9EURO|nr:3-hydroxyisobutyrate dehydrogenase [Cladophialophora carrionii CBS 160.54]ETI21112.1 3-hydroxyisobutyrate dehydrogenase [Cladophialophora carrionii CBS 160.54]